VESRHKTYCKEHVPPEARATNDRRKAASPAAARIRRQSGRTAAITRPGASPSGPSGRTAVIASTPSARLPQEAAAPSRTTAIVVIAVACLAVVGAIGVIAMSGLRTSTPTGTGPHNPADPRVAPTDPQYPAGDRQTALEARALAEQTKWKDFDAGNPPSGRDRAAAEGFDRTFALIAEVEAFARDGGKLPEGRLTTLNRLLDYWAEAATRSAIADIRAAADLKEQRESPAAAAQYVREMMAGDDRYLARRFITNSDLWPARQLRDMLERFERNSGGSSLSNAQRAALTALDALVAASAPWSREAESTRDERWFNQGLGWLRKVNGLPFDHPSIEDANGADGMPLKRFKATRVEIAQRLFAWLDAKYRELAGYATGDTVRAFMELAKAFLHDAPDDMPERTIVAGWLRDMTAQLQQQPTADTGDLTAFLDKAEREGRAAVASTDFHVLLRAFARLQLAATVIDIADERRGGVIRLMLELHKQYFATFEAQAAGVDKTVDRASWRAAGFMLFQVCGVFDQLATYQQKVQEMSLQKYGAHPVSEWRAMIEFLDETVGADGFGSLTGDALWVYYAGLIGILAQEYTRSRNPDLVPLLNDAATRCVRDVMQRDLTAIGGSQRASRLAEQAAKCHQSFISAAQQPEIARSLEQQRARAEQLAGSLPRATAK
ncbi:MAG: hypothetical protein AB7K09_12815, partial [Planctomycetota bacterium]